MKPHPRASGQALVEFALALPLVLLVVLLFIDFSRVLYVYSSLSNAVREGARYAVVTRFPSVAQREIDIRQQVLEYAVSVPVSASDITIYCDRDTADTNNPCDAFITVSAQVSLTPLVPFTSQLMGSGSAFVVEAESTMQMTPYGSYSE